MFSGFRCNADDICAILGYYATKIYIMLYILHTDDKQSHFIYAVVIFAVYIDYMELYVGTLYHRLP